MVFRNGVVSANLTGAAALTKNGFTTVTLSGNNAGFTGSTTLVNGMLNLDYTTNNGEKLSNSAALVSTGGGHLTINGNASGTTLETVGSFTLNAGALHINVNNGSGQTATLNLGAITRVTGSSVEFNLSSGSAIVQTSTLNGANSILGGYGTVNGSQFATVSGGVIQGLNSTVSNNLSAWQVQGDLTDSTGYTGTVSEIVINSLRFNAAGAASTVTVASGSRLTIGGGGILVTSNVGSGMASITGGILAAGSGDELIVHQNNTTSAFTIGSSIIGGTAVTKSGAGTLLISGANTYTGQTTINEGTVRLSGGNAIGDGSFVTIKNDTGAVLDLNNGSETIAGLVSFGGLSTTGYTSGMVAIGSGMLTLNLTAARSYQGGISGNGTLVKTGASEQIFYGANAGFTGTVIINQGLLNLSESATVLNGATAFILNGAGELLGDQDVADIDHIGNAASITLNNTGANRGLWIRNPDLDSSEAETVGAIILGAGHNVIQADSNAGNAEIITLTAASLTRNNHATLLVRGQGLGGTAGPRGQIIFTAAPGGAVGGGGAAATTTMSIIPYLVGESVITTDATLADNFGNSFVFNTGTTNGLRPLVTTVGAGEEYIHNEAGYNALTGAALNNVRFVANPTATLTGAATQINSLVLDSSAAALAVNGPASTLNIKSGAILATTTTPANAISLGGFSSLTTDAGNDFIVYVTNAANTFTLNSALTSVTPLVKSGAGTLALTSTANAFTDLYLNQGFVQADNVDKLGTGQLKFMGGGIKLAAGFTGDIGAKVWDISTGGGFLDTGLVTGGYTLAGGIDDSTVSADDMLTISTQAAGSTGVNGRLTIQGASSYTGLTVFNHSGINTATLTSVLLNGTTNQTINGNVHIGSLGTLVADLDVIVGLGANEQIVDTASITFRSSSGEEAYFKLFGFTETVAGISAVSRGVIENHESATDSVLADGKLIVNSSQDFSYTGYMRDRASGTGGVLAFEKQGTGTQTLVGANILHTGTTTISGGTLHLQGVTAWNSNIVNNSVLILDETAVRTHTRDITGTGSLIKQGSAALTFAGGLALTYQGGTTVRGGTMTVGSSIDGTTSLNVVNVGSTLALTGGITNASSITNLVVEHGGTLSLLDGVGNKLTGLTTLQLGSHGGTMTTLNLNVGDFGTAGDNLNTDLLSLLTGGTLGLFTGNQITLNLTDAGLNPGQTYNLISTADGGLLSVLGSGDWLLGSTPGGFTSITLNKTGNLISITTGTLITGASYWTGLTNNAWNAGAGNWSTDKAGTIPASSIPGQGTDVVFVADSHAGGALVTTLEQNFKINSLTFEASTSTPSSVTINPGTISTSRLEVAPQVATDGIRITAGGPAAVTIATALRLGAAQTWNVADANSLLTISGALQGEADVIKTGLGKVVLSAVADPTFNTGLSTDVSINAGILEITHIGALGTIASGNGSRVIINPGGVFYYTNTTASTAIANVPVGLVLGGGILSVGGAAHFYGGNINVSSGSLINMRGSNAAATNAAAFSIALTGVLSGSGSLTIDSVDTLTAGNAETGTLTLSNNANSWAGDLLINRGTVVTTAANGLGGGNITYNQFGRIITRAVDGTTYNLAGTMNFAAGALGEFSVDNTGALAADFVINQNGQVNIGSGGTGATVRLNLADAASTLNITGGVVLGGNSSISVEGGDANSLVTISGVISDGGSGYTLAVNDDAGTWAATNTILRLTGLNTFSGNLSLTEGTLQFNTASNSGGAASSLGQGNTITLGGTLSFIGDGAVNSQSTNRAITQTANSILNVSGTNDATMTYTGAISAGAFQMQLTGSGIGAGFITGGITQTTIAPDLLVSSGNWTVSGTQSTVGDDLKVNGVGTVLNLGTTGVLSYVTGTSNFIYLGNGGTINLGADDVSSAALGLEGILPGFETAGAVTTFNTNTFNITTPRLDVGQIADGFEGNVIGSGTITVTVTTAGAGLSLYRGSVSANLSGAGAVFKAGIGDVTLSGDNSGLTGTTRLDAGNLILDYTTSNTAKLNAATALDMLGATLTLNGNNTAASAQSVASFTMSSGGANRIILNQGTGLHGIVLNLGTITRAVNSQDGTLRIVLSSGIQSATNGVTTTTALSNGLIGAAAYLTVEDGSGTWFATKDGNNIIGLVSTPKNDISSWATGDHITDATTGFTGTYANVGINSLRYNAVGGSVVNISATGVLGIATGGILVTGNVGGAPSLLGGTLFSGALASNVPELIITHDGSTTFQIGSAIRTNSALTKSGAGTLLLSGSNVYTGTTDIQNGTLQVSGGHAIGDTSLVALADDKATTFQLLASETIGRLAGGSAAAGLNTLATVDIGSFTLTLNQTATSTYSGLFSGDGTIVKTGASTFTYSGTSAAFTGTLLIDQGQLLMNGNNANFTGVTAIILNGSGSLRNDQTNNILGDRISNTATIALNSTSAGEGLRFRNTDDGSRSETVGALTLGSGHNVITAESTNTGVFFGGWIFASLAAVNNHATSLVRGTTLGSGTDDGRIRFTAAPTGGVGTTAGGAIGTTKNLIILPYLVGDVSASGLGNSFVTDTGATNGLRPLAAAEYEQDSATPTAGNNVRYTTTTTITAATSVNSLVLDGASAITLTGPATSFEITSGAILSAQATANTIGTFTSLTTGNSRDYTLYVTDPAGSLTISSLLTSAAALVKSGAGSLILGGVNTALTDVYLNQGTVEIADLDSIGGDAGGLVFAGGTLRLGAGFADDISTRTISFLQGSGTIDTNGIDLALASSLGSGFGGFTKAGAGTLTLNSAAIFTGTTTITGGTLAIGATNATGGGDLVISGGGVLEVVSSALNIALLTTSGAGPVINGANVITASTGFFFNHTGDTTINAILAGGGGLLKAQANTVTLTALNTYTGPTEIHNGVLSIGSIGNVGSGASSLGNPGSAEDGIIRLGFATTAGTLTYTGSGHSTDRIIALQGTSGGGVLDADGIGALVLTGGIRMENAGDKTLTLRGDSAPAIINTIGGIQELSGVLTLNKSDANTWMVNGGNAYTGVTQIDNGTLMIGVTTALPTVTTVRLGSGATAGTFDLNGFNQTIAALLVQTTSGSVTNMLVVDSGNTLTVNGAVTIGANANDSITNLTATGGGSLVNNNDGGTFQVGGATTTNNENTSTVDFSGLGAFTANLGATGIFRIGDNSATTSATGPSAMTLATDNTITAGTLQVASTQTNALQTLRLGAGTNTLNVNTLQVSGATRGIGTLNFASGAGTVALRAADGTSAAVVNVAQSTTSTGNNLTGTIDLTGHDADLLISTLTMADRTAGVGSTTATMSFDTGTLNVTNLSMARRSGSGTGNATATVNLGDGAALGSPTTTIGAINMAVNTSSGGAAIADFNVTGGNVTIGTGSGTAINMANAGTGRTVTSNINLTGGTVDVTGNIIRTGGAGTENVSVILNGSTLDMNGNSIGTGAAQVTLLAQSGTLQNLAQLNGGGALTKTTTGLLILEGTNTYTGATDVNAGILQVGTAGAGQSGSGVVTVASGATLAGTGTVVGSTIIGGGAVLQAGDVTTAGDAASTITGHGSLTFTAADTSLTIQDGGQIRIGVSSPTLESTVISFANGVFTFNGTDYNTAKDLFDNESAALGLWNVAPASPASHDFINLTGMNSTLSIGDRSSSTFGDGSVVVGGMLGAVQVGQVFNLIDWSGAAISGNFDVGGFSRYDATSNVSAGDLDLVGLGAGLGYDVSAFTTYGVVVIVPEPSRTLFLMLGLLGLMLRRRRR